MKMRVIKGIKGLTGKFKNPVLTIGIFDGVHLAHQQIIQQVVRQAKQAGGKSIVLTFNPHPVKLLNKNSATGLITSLERRLELIKRLNVDICLVVDFNPRLSRLSAEEFVKKILVQAIGVKHVIVGSGFRFGRNKTGTFRLLKKLARNFSFKVRQIKALKINGQMVSSTKIRALIRQGKIIQANRMLGRSFSITGAVRRGSARGRILGYPTANIAAEQEIIPASGVYVTFVKLGNKVLSGILNIGYCPTFKPQLNSFPTVEVHIFNFHKIIYGRKVQLFFIQRIRDEKKFPHLFALLQRLKQDRRQAKKILRTTPQPI